jgi:hypothetical protein
MSKKAIIYAKTKSLFRQDIKSSLILASIPVDVSGLFVHAVERSHICFCLRIPQHHKPEMTLKNCGLPNIG